jgi:hypothetical protein
MADEHTTTVNTTAYDTHTHGAHVTYLILALLAVATFTVSMVGESAALVVLLIGAAAAGYMAYILAAARKAQARAKNRFDMPSGERLPGMHMPLRNDLHIAKHTSAEKPILRIASQGTPRSIWGR